MVTNVHITRISEKSPTNDFAYEIDTFKNDVTFAIDCPDRDAVQIGLSWISLLTGQHTDHHTHSNNKERKYPIRVFAIQAEA